jgi:hypothetical protein
VDGAAQGSRGRPQAESRAVERIWLSAVLGGYSLLHSSESEPNVKERRPATR